MGLFINIAIWTIKVAIPTIIFLLGVNLLVVSKSKWEAQLGGILGINDLEISGLSFVVLKVVATLLVLASLGIVYLLFIAE